MPKREKTPPPAADEPKYLTVVHPYPPHANMDLEGDQKELAFWLASCTGKDVLLAFFYKPRSPDTIIIEVDREFQHWECLLGAHPWARVFREPRPEYRDNVSRVFYCQWHTGRQVQKYGWKRINVQEHWFRQWTPINKIVRHPYPKTSYCQVPTEDATNAPLCRPLPVSLFPVQDAPRPPPVGTEGWQQTRDSSTPTNNAWNKGPPAGNTQNSNKPPGIKSTASAGSNGYGARQNDWTNNDASPGIAAPTPVYGPPPGLPPPRGFAASTPSGTYHTAPSTAWTITSGSSRAASSVGSDSDGGSIGGTPTQSVYQDFESVAEFPQVVEDMKDLAVEENIWETATDNWDSASRSYDEFYTEAPEQPPEENLWAEYTPLAQSQTTVAFLCPEHGKLCPKGICIDYKRWVKAEERAKQNAEREAAMADKKKNKRSKTRSQSRPTIVERPPHLTRGGAPPATRSESGPSAPSPPQEEEPVPEEGDTDDPQKLEFKPRPAHLTRGAAPTSNEAPTPASPTSSSSSSAPAPAPRARPAHLMQGAAGKAPASADPPPPRAPPSDNGWGHIPRDPWGGQSVGKASVKGDDAAASAGGWGNVSNGPWGSGSVGGKSSQGKGKEKAQQTKGKGKAKASGTGGPSKAAPAAGDAPKKSWADQMEDDDSRSVVSSSNGWGHVSNGPW